MDFNLSTEIPHSRLQHIASIPQLGFPLKHSKHSGSYHDSSFSDELHSSIKPGTFRAGTAAIVVVIAALPCKPCLGCKDRAVIKSVASTLILPLFKRVPHDDDIVEFEY